jgi:hypothetical protein
MRHPDGEGQRQPPCGRTAGNCTALVKHLDGRLDLIDLKQDTRDPDQEPEGTPEVTHIETGSRDTIAAY